MARKRKNPASTKVEKVKPEELDLDLITEDDSEYARVTDEEDEEDTSEEIEMLNRMDEDDEDLDGVVEIIEVVDDTPLTGFNSIIVPVTMALKSDQGISLSCKVKVINPGKEAIIYQGLINNVYGRLFADRPHIIYRHSLRKLLQSHELTKDLFTEANLKR